MFREANFVHSGMLYFIFHFVYSGLVKFFDVILFATFLVFFKFLMIGDKDLVHPAYFNQTPFCSFLLFIFILMRRFFFQLIAYELPSSFQLLP